MSPRPRRGLTLYLLIYGILCLGLADTQTKKNPQLLGSHREIGYVHRNQKQHGDLATSGGTRLADGGLEQADINKLLPYEAVENTDVPERQLIPLDIIYKYHLPTKKPKHKPFTLLDRFTSGVSRTKRQSDSHAKVGKPVLFHKHDETHVPKMLRYFKQAKRNLTREKQQISHGFGNNWKTGTSPSVVARENVWEPLFPGLKKEVPLDDKFPVTEAALPSKGYPWPLPQALSTNPEHVFGIDAWKFRIELSKDSYNCDILQAALTRYSKHLVRLSPTTESPLNDSRWNSSDTGPKTIQWLQLTVTSPCSDYPQIQSNEAYELVVGEASVSLKAEEVWGALRGLHTFSQMIYLCQHQQCPLVGVLVDYESPDKEQRCRHYLMGCYRLLVNGLLLCINKTSISDYPRFKHRGIMLDTSRHYISPRILKKNMDVMEMNKLNVFHWHIVDDQSFPFVSLQYPDLSAKGAYSPKETYSHAVIKELIDYGRLRGIRIVPEFDTPGHVRSWGAGYPEVLTDCGPEGLGPMDPSKNITFQFLRGLFSEVMSLFPDAIVHLGGDECPYHCWKGNHKIQAFMRENGFGEDISKLESYYIHRLLLNLNELKKKKQFVFWQDILDNNIEIPNDTIIQIWKGFGGADIRALHKATEMGLKIIYSAAWYLNYISYGKDWVKYYTADPTNYLWTDERKQLIIGGEACLWGEYIDDNNLLQTLWPRASAVAERLWSSDHVINAATAEPRFEEHRCRMIKEDIPASPNSGPGSCDRVPAV